MVDGSAGGRDKAGPCARFSITETASTTPSPAMSPAGTAARADSRGLWMARQLCDVVSDCRAPGAFTVRLY